MPFTLAIIGRPNVGKSTLFNRLVGRRLALTDDRPGVTRDVREGAARLGALRFTVIDTAGLEDATDNTLPGRMRRLTERAVANADACLFVIDARAGVTAADVQFADMVRRTGRPVLLAANKAEGHAATTGVIEAYDLGLGEPIALSAEHGEGMAELAVALTPLVAAAETPATTALSAPETNVDADADDRPITPERPLQIAVIGRPNAGKSTLVNTILGEDRLLTGPEAGITRDAISISTLWADMPVRIFDTAGMRKRAKVQEKLEKLSVADGLRAVQFAEVVIVLLDAAIPFESQDLRLADLAEREGRAVVVAVNKWDLEKQKQAKRNTLTETFDRLLPQLRGAALVPVSARTGQGLDHLRKAILRAHAVWNSRVSTARLNRWLAAMVAAHPPPAPSGRRIKLRYMTQAKTRPPGFVVMCSQPEKLPDSYTRYLVNGLRDAFDMPGTPIRLHMRSQADQNPYKNRRKSTPSRLTKHVKKGVTGQR